MNAMTKEQLARRIWGSPTRPFTLAEVVADGIVHVVGLVAAIALGSIILAFAISETAPREAPALAIYIASLLAVLSVSLAYNLSPISSLKDWLARFDQAAIFLFIAGTYTPFLAILGGSPTTIALGAFVWGASIVGIALKLIVPERFGRLAIMLYLAIGWSGVAVFQSLANTLPPATFWLLLAGGVVYSAGIVFHLWEKLKFQNVLWHVFVVVGAVLHLVAILDCMVISRL
ncbi:COG1272: Predicted membrane protein hemolysin III homolog [Devosia sp. DBB001]|nr:COG1272: Predicted membrane protein hemolysin III homolog [Devosia sp. DBB001]